MTLTLTEYATETARTAGLPRGLTPEESQLNAMALGLAGESGEFVDLVKKMLYHDKPVSIAEFTKELGDVIWYWTRALPALNTILGTNLTHEDVLFQNVEKLRARYPDGFSTEASAARVDVAESCGAWGDINGQPCPLPVGHNMGRVDIPSYHGPNGDTNAANDAVVVPSVLASRTIDQEEGPLGQRQGDFMAGGLLGPGHQTDLGVDWGFGSPFCYSHPDEFCPEWCEGSSVAVDPEATCAA